MFFIKSTVIFVTLLLFSQKNLFLVRIPLLLLLLIDSQALITNLLKIN